MADIGSRGQNHSLLANEQLWWHGPNWLTIEKKQWRISKFQKVSELELPELKKIAKACVASRIKSPNKIVERYSDLRFCKITKGKSRAHKIGVISFEE